MQSLEVLGINPLEHDIRFVEDNWENPSTGSAGLVMDHNIIILQIHSNIGAINIIVQEIFFDGLSLVSGAYDEVIKTIVRI